MGIAAAFAVAGCVQQEDKPVKFTAGMRATVAVAAGMEEGCEHDYNPVQVISPNCTEQGYTIYLCANCGDTYTDDFIPANSHSFKDIIVPSTCTHKGYVTHFCTTCGYEYSDSFVDESGHSYEEEIVDPTCTEQGYTLHTCTVCEIGRAHV